MINLKFIETHNPIFINGVNLGQKIDITKRTNLYIQHDEKKDKYLIWVNGGLAILPPSSVNSSIPIDIKDTGYKHPTFEVEIQKPVEAAQFNGKIQAQISHPHDHVFAQQPGLTNNK